MIDWFVVEGLTGANVAPRTAIRPALRIALYLAQFFQQNISMSAPCMPRSGNFRVRPAPLVHTSRSPPSHSMTVPVV